MSARILVLLILGISLISGCGGNRYYEKDEKALGTTRRAPTLNHLAVYFPGGIALNSPGYLLGLEDADAKRITTPGDLRFGSSNGNGATIGYLKDQLRTRKLPFISHIIKYAAKHYGEGDCALYNYYRDHNGELVPFCESVKQYAVNHSDNDYYKAFSNSWTAIDILRDQLKRDVSSGKYTHIVVMSMGMDTPQELAIRNFNTIIWSIRKVAGDKFRPLVIGISWPSFYDSRWIGPIWETLAYPNKADEADKLGITWLGVLMHDVVGPLNKQIKTIAITHSFGSRAVSMATCVGPEIKRDDAYERNNKNGPLLDNFIAYAPAFSLHRFLKAPYLLEEVYYKDGCRNGGRIVLTSSDKDIASKMPIWVDLGGNYDDYRKFCRKKHDISKTCVTVDENGAIREPYADDERFLYIDTTDLMKYHVPDSDGGAHSDIFRPQVARMLWSILSRPSPKQ